MFKIVKLLSRCSLNKSCVAWLEYTRSRHRRNTFDKPKQRSASRAQHPLRTGAPFLSLLGFVGQVEELWTLPSHAAVMHTTSLSLHNLNWRLDSCKHVNTNILQSAMVNQSNWTLLESSSIFYYNDVLWCNSNRLFKQLSKNILF